MTWTLGRWFSHLVDEFSRTQILRKRETSRREESWKVKRKMETEKRTTREWGERQRTRQERIVFFFIPTFLYKTPFVPLYKNETSVKYFFCAFSGLHVQTNTNSKFQLNSLKFKLKIPLVIINFTKNTLSLLAKLTTKLLIYNKNNGQEYKYVLRVCIEEYKDEICWFPPPDEKIWRRGYGGIGIDGRLGD